MVVLTLGPIRFIFKYNLVYYWFKLCYKCTD